MIQKWLRSGSRGRTWVIPSDSKTTQNGVRGHFWAKCTVSRRWFAVEVCDSFTRSHCTQRFFVGNRLRFLCGNDTVAVAMHFAMKNGQISFSLREFLAISAAIWKIASDCGCDAVVHLVFESIWVTLGSVCRSHFGVAFILSVFLCS